MSDRMRLVAAAAALLVAAPMTSLGTAPAEQVVGQAKPERTITMKGVNPRPGVFLAKGGVDPSYKERRAIMQRKVDGANRWSDWKKFRTDEDSRYRTRIAALERIGTVCYRVKIKGNDTFKTSFSRRTVCIETEPA